MPSEFISIKKIIQIWILRKTLVVKTLKIFCSIDISPKFNAAWEYSCFSQKKKYKVKIIGNVFFLICY